MATTISGLLETYIDNKVADDKKGDWPRSVKDLTWWIYGAGINLRFFSIISSTEDI